MLKVDSFGLNLSVSAISHLKLSQKYCKIFVTVFIAINNFMFLLVSDFNPT